MKKVGLDKNEVERRILKGITPWKDKATQRYNCRKARERFLSQQQEVSKVTTRKVERTSATTRPRPRKEEVDEKADPINKSKTEEKRKVSLRTRHERTTKESTPKRFEDKSVKKAKEEIKQKKDSDADSKSKRRRKRRQRVFECPEERNALCPEQKLKFCGY